MMLNSRTFFGLKDFEVFHIHKKKQRRPLLYQLFTKAIHKSTLVVPNQTQLGFAMTNDKASYVAKDERICLFSVAKKASLRKQELKPCVPFTLMALSF